ncbi:hypothetical protein F2P81_009768 [Scophthalmus maximus]|uniref:Galectin n=1 Tax=Scophthalmus maximus TaxID=52904 RepID=A0A6A4T0W2_SCOMX|nr:hypothetical protein F2P81_009768 [Scophthalmus maximus]
MGESVRPQMLKAVIKIIGYSLICCCCLLVPQPSKGSLLFPATVVSRLVFVPLLMMCNVENSRLTVLFSHDAAFVAIMALFSFSNGYLATLCMAYAPHGKSRKSSGDGAALNSGVVHEPLNVSSDAAATNDLGSLDISPRLHFISRCSDTKSVTSQDLVRVFPSEVDCSPAERDGREEARRGFTRGPEKSVIVFVESPSVLGPSRRVSVGVNLGVLSVQVVPFRGLIPGGLRPGKKVVVVGVVDSRPDRFYVALTCGRGTSREPPPDVALELCVRFGDRQVLRRACVSGSWGDVDRAVPFFPFIRDQPFKMEIHCEQSRFRVFVDGQKLFDFHHRVASLGAVDTLWIKGNVAVTKLA